MPSVASDNNKEATPSPSPTWDGSPNTLPAFYEALIKFLPKKNANYRNLVEQGCRVEGRKTLFHSINHITRYVNNEIVNKKGDRGSFRVPVLVDKQNHHASDHGRLSHNLFYITDRRLRRTQTV